MRKKVLALTMAGIMAVSLSGCGGGAATATTAATTAAATTAAAPAETEPAAEGEPAEKEAAGPLPLTPLSPVRILISGFPLRQADRQILFPELLARAFRRLMEIPRLLTI